MLATLEIDVLYAEERGLEPPSACARRFSRAVRYQFRALLRFKEDSTVPKNVVVCVRSGFISGRF